MLRTTLRPHQLRPVSVTSDYYQSDFPGTENPVSEGGRWLGGFTTGKAWSDCQTVPGQIYGRQQLDWARSYSDGSAYLTGTWSPDQTVTAVVYQNATVPAENWFEESEIRLRGTLTANSLTSYEISWKMRGATPSSAYLILVRWNGPWGNFTYLSNVNFIGGNGNGSQYALVDGDVVTGTVIGNTIYAWKNGVLQATALITDTPGAVFSGGAPGIGFNLEAAGAGHNADYGFRSIEAMGSSVWTELAPMNLVAKGGSGVNILTNSFASYSLPLDDTHNQGETPGRVQTAGTAPGGGPYSSDPAVWPSASLDVGFGGVGKSLRINCTKGVEGAPPPPNNPQQSWSVNSITSGSIPWPAAGRTIVIEFRFKTNPGGGPNSNGMKWCEAWFSSGTPQRIQFAPSGGNGTTGPLWSVVLGNNPGGTVNRTVQPRGPYWKQVNDGLVRTCKMLYRPNTSSSYSHTPGSGSTSATELYTGTSSRDGRVAIFMDDQKILDYQQALVDVTPAGGTGVWCKQCDVDMIPGVGGSNIAGAVNALKGFLEHVNGADNDWSIWYQDLYIYQVNGAF
ncbi:MAG TPA: hypothetical protein VJN95_08775 [Gemmatimonadales bacterium]|nr:hypothetical protein [Gemmatimonadales bacterium]